MDGAAGSHIDYRWSADIHFVDDTRKPFHLHAVLNYLGFDTGLEFV